MPRPHKCRKIFLNPEVVFFKPAGIMMKELEEVILTLDEFEAIRLADYEGLYQEKAAERMNISRQTFGNIINSAHKKIADFLINAKALQINGGKIELSGSPQFRSFICIDCNNIIDIPYGIAKPNNCPNCKSNNIHRADNDSKRGFGNCKNINRDMENDNNEK